MSTKYAIDRDLKQLAKMGDAIGDYVLNDQVFVNIGGFFTDGSMPELTYGVMLLRIRRLNHFRSELSKVQQATLDKAIDQYNEVRTEWRVHYEEKMMKEAQSRLKLMNGFFQDCRDSMSTCAQVYLPEANRRTIVQELLMEMNEYNMDASEVMEKVYLVDNELRRWITPGDFIWSDNLQPVYPKEKFWWLYGQPDANA